MSDDEFNSSASEDERPKKQEKPKKGVVIQEPEEDPNAGLSRKERKKLEKEAKMEAELKELQEAAENVNKDGDSPFMVTLEQDAVAEGSRDISLNKVSVSVNGKTLFKDTTVKFSAGSRYGVMGPNGRGKSTLLRLLATRELPVQQSLTMLLVEQEQEITGGELSAVTAVVQSHKLQAAYQEEVAKLRELDGEKMTDEQMERLQFLDEELNLMNAQQAEAKARRILFGLGFPTEWHDRPTASFSGGWRKRIALASAVFIEPDVLMLDEPTNHLDLNAVIWLESYLVRMYNKDAKRPKTLLVVSHDAGFLDGICTHMVAIESFKLNYFRGGYSTFNAQVELRHAEIDKKHHQLQQKIKEMKKKGMSNEKVDEWLNEQVRQGKIESELVDKRREYVVSFPFKAPMELRDGCIVKLEDVAFKYPGDECPILFKDVNCSLWNDSRITLCGPNGIGKSTLLNLMTGVLEPTFGYITVNRQVRIGRYNQHFVDKLPLERTPIDYLRSVGAKDEHDARRMLGSFGLEGLVHKNMIATLSGGQKARVALAAISCEMPHFLLFDEPTNHLDMESIDALCKAINNFKGGILVVTHDARLIQETNMQLWIAGDLNVKPFNGTLDDYKTHVREIFEAEEDKKEWARAMRQAEKAELKAIAKSDAKLAAMKPEEALAVVKAEKKEELVAEVEDFFDAMGKKSKKDKKDKTDKADKKEKKDKKDKGSDGDDAAKKEKKEKKDKKDKKQEA